MMQWSLQQIAATVAGRLQGADAAANGVSTDSRSLAPGNLFVALSGARSDGHDYLESCAGRAAGAIVSRPQPLALGQIIVPDTLHALQQLARAWRRQWPGSLVGLTGSNGKTTVKEMLRAILAEIGPTLATAGNLNNHIGVPLTLLRLAAHHRFAVIEMGANHCGEIAQLAALAEPDIGLVTNAGHAHLEGFGGLDGVARGKGELYTALPAAGVAIINADDAYADYWTGLAGSRRIIRCGLTRPATITASVAADGRLHIRGLAKANCPVSLPLPGEHNRRNALAAAAAAQALGAPCQAIAAGLSQMQPNAGRLRELPGLAGSTLIDDSYNANPTSLHAAAQTLAARSGRGWLVLGDMAELGAQARALHRDCGQAIKAAGIERLWTLGPLASAAAAGFGAGAQAYQDPAALIAALQAELAPDLTLLIKGSRSMHMETIVQALTQPEGTSHAA